MGSRLSGQTSWARPRGDKRRVRPLYRLRWAPAPVATETRRGAVLPRAQPCHAWQCHAWLCIALHSIAMLCNRLGRMASVGEDPIRPVGVGVRWHFPKRVRSRHPRQVSSATGAAGVSLGPRARALAADLKHRLGRLSEGGGAVPGGLGSGPVPGR
jgi:hypothetical protein